MNNVLRPLPVDDFIRLAAHAGLEVSREDLEQLERRRLIKPYESGSLGRLHLYVLATYFDAVRVFRHPWTMQASTRSLDDVKSLCDRVVSVRAILESDEFGDEPESALAALVADIERFIAGIDPFGPLADIIDIARADFVEKLRGNGRLYAELRATATALAAESERVKSPATREPATGEVTGGGIRRTAEINQDDFTPAGAGEITSDLSRPPEADRAKALRTPAEDLGSSPAAERRPATGTEETAEQEEKPEEKFAKESKQELEEASEQELLEEPEQELETASEQELEEESEQKLEEESEQELEEESEQELEEESEQELAEDSEQELAEDSEQELAEDSEQEVALEGEGELDEASEPLAPLPEDPHERPALTASAAADATAELHVVKPRDGGSEDSEGKDEEAEAETETKQNPFAREQFPRSGRTQALLERLEEIKTQKTDDDDRESPQPEGLEEKVNELNQLREQLIRAQDWAGLVALYEERIDLFDEPADRQQVFLTLATLYELKLQDSDRAFHCFDEAFAINVYPGRVKTLDSLRKIGARADQIERYVGWLEENLENAPEELRSVMQRDLSGALRDTGHPQRAFLSYAAFLAEEPDARLTADALDFLDELSLAVSDDELAAFYEGTLEQETSSETRALVAVRAGMFYQGCNRPEDAIRCFKETFEADPQSEIAFSNLSRLYERESDWGQLRLLIAAKLKTAEGEEARRLRRELGRVVSAETSTADAIQQFSDTLREDPNDDSTLERLLQAYRAQERHTDGYAHLNRLLERDLDPPQEVRVRKALATIAVEHLESPEEAAHHLQHALQLAGPDREILEGLASVRMDAGEWADALAALRVLTNGSVTLPEASLRKWLNVGIEAARMAERPDDVRYFQEHLERAANSAS